MGIQGSRRPHEETGKIRNCKEYILHEIGNESLLPKNSIIYCEDTHKIYFNNKEIKLEEIKL